MTLSFDPVNHRYSIGNIVLPSVTQVLSSLQMGTPDYSGIAQDVIERAGNRGTEVHGIICGLSMRSNRGGIGTIRKTRTTVAWSWKEEAQQRHRNVTGVEGYVAAAKKFCAEMGFTIVRSEVRLYSPAFRYAGTVDCDGRFSDKSIGTVDWKTGDLSPSVALQLVAYNGLISPAKMFQRRRVAVKLNRDGTYRAREYPMSSAREDWGVFLSALACYNWKRKYEKS